jgi:hypothetical protein
MEFLRFGSSIPGSYWGCCAVCIIQDFKQRPDEKASIELVDGDQGIPMVKGGKSMFLGKTWKEVFESRLRIGTFSSRDMPNHVFLAILTAEQIDYEPGKSWLKILKENGFEFIRTTDNSVYSGKNVISSPGEKTSSPHENYIFGLFRNIGKGYIENPYTPPKAWTDMSPVVPEAWEYVTKSGSGPEKLAIEVQEAQLELWNASSPAKMYTEEELTADGVPVWLAGRRSTKPQELKSYRKESTETTAVSKASPFGKAATPTPVPEGVYNLDYEDEDEDDVELCDCDDCCGEG